MSQAKPKTTAKPVILTIGGARSDTTFVCRDLASANRIAQAFIDADALPTDLCSSMDEPTYTIPFMEEKSELAIKIELSGKYPIDLNQRYLTQIEYQERQDAIHRDMPEIVNFDAMDEYPPAEHDSHNAE